jgi:hypothetical protein
MPRTNVPQNTHVANTRCANLVPYSERYFHCVHNRNFSRRLTGLRRSAPSDLNNGRNEECKQGYHEYDLRGGERGSCGDAEAETARDQSNDKEGNRPPKHDDLLTRRRCCRDKTPKSQSCSKQAEAQLGSASPFPNSESGDVGNDGGLEALNIGCNSNQGETGMPKEAHNKAAEHHENAAKSHRTAAEHHGKGEHMKGRDESTKAQAHSKTAREHSETAHGKSQAQK